MNKFNNILKSLFLGLMVSMLPGCNDLLDVTPPSEISPEKFLWNEEQLASYVNNYYYTNTTYSEYNVTQGGKIPTHAGGAGESFYHEDLDTDNVTSKIGNNRYVPGLLRVDQTGGYWNFTNIYALNYYLETVVPRYEAGTLTGGETNIKHYVGEVYFLRAQEYFFRLRRLGDFPIVTETLPDEQKALVEASKRRPRNEVARFILSDLDKAIGLMSNTPPGGRVRITKNAALVLKARVALFEATWEKYHAGTSHVPNGPGWPGAEKDYNQNYQFPSGSLEGEVDFFLSEAMGAASLIADAIPLTENNQIIRESASQPVNPYYDMFATPNPSAYSEVIMYRTYNSQLGVRHTYNHMIYHGAARGYTRQFADNFLMANGLPIYAAGSGYQGDDYIEDTKIGRDSRWRLFMKAPNEVKAFQNIATPETFPNAPLIISSDVKFSTATGYLLGKGLSHNYTMQVLNEDITAPVIFRAAEAYLVYLEASYLKNGKIDSKADGYWRAIRRRAGVDENYQKTINATVMEEEAKNDWGAYSHGQLVDPTLYNIRRERRCELIGEGFRYNDLIRWRALDQLNGFQLEGCKIWGPLQERYAPGELLSDQADEKNNTVSSPSLSEYFRPYQLVQGNNPFYNGLNFTNAHYLYPIAVQHFLITASDGQTISTSPIYQNQGWPTVAGAGADEY